jgi:phosphoribosylformylglycinamidine cyclo-ligase
VLELAGDSKIGGVSAAEALLAPTRIYVRPVLDLMKKVDVRGLAHITGGGITENLPRIHAESLHAEIDTSSWEQGSVFDWLANAGNIETAEMRRTFNCGVGMIVVVDGESAEEAVAELQSLGEDAWIIGRMADGAGEVRFL